MLILRSMKNNFPRSQYTLSMNIKYADKLLGHLTERNDFCDSCEEQYRHCREGYQLDFSKNIAGIYDFPATLPFMIDNVEEYLPDSVPMHDVLIAVSVNEEILISFIQRFPLAKGVIIPIEESNWITPYGIKTIREICEQKGIEVSFPKPFCSFNPNSGVLLDFKRTFKIGKPEIKFVLEGNVIKEANVLCSSPCGATYYTAAHLIGKKLDDNLDYIIDSSLFHYPCIGGSSIDKNFQDSIMHHAVKLQKNILRHLHAIRPV